MVVDCYNKPKSTVVKNLQGGGEKGNPALQAIKLYFSGIHRIIYILGALVVLTIADGVITNYLINSGLASEANPLMKNLAGDAGFIALKVVSAMVCAVILWDIYKRWPKAALVAIWCFIAVYAVIVSWNISLIVSLGT